MHVTILPTDQMFDTAAIVRGMRRNTPEEAEVEVRDLMVVGEVEGQEGKMFLVLASQHRATCRMVSYPLIFDASFLRQMEAAGA
jgi:hypothetical protein